MIALAGLARDDEATGDQTAEHQRTTAPSELSVPERASFLPYLPVIAAILVTPGLTTADALLARALADAIRGGALRLDYQPIIDLTDGHISGIEALARWRHEGRDIPTDVFIRLPNAPV